MATPCLALSSSSFAFSPHNMPGWPTSLPSAAPSLHQHRCQSWSSDQIFRPAITHHTLLKELHIIIVFLFRSSNRHTWLGTCCTNNYSHSRVLGCRCLCLSSPARPPLTLVAKPIQLLFHLVGRIAPSHPSCASPKPCTARSVSIPRFWILVFRPSTQKSI